MKIDLVALVLPHQHCWNFPLAGIRIAAVPRVLVLPRFIFQDLTLGSGREG